MQVLCKILFTCMNWALFYKKGGIQYEISLMPLFIL